MRRTTLSFSLLICVLLPGMMLIVSVHGEEAAVPYPSFAKNFTKSVTPVVSAGPTSLFQTQVSSVAVKAFESRGIYGITDNQKVIYYADFELSLKCNVFSKATVQTTGSGTSSVPTEWAYIVCYEDYGLTDTWRYYPLAANIPYAYISYSSAVLQSLSVKLDYNPLESKLLTFEGSEINATVPHTAVVFDELAVETSSVEEIGQSSSYIGGAAVEVGAGSIVIDGSNIPGGLGGMGATSLKNQVGALALGIKPVGSATPQTIQQWISNPAVRGESEDPQSTSENHVVYTLASEMRPEIVGYNQAYNVRDAYIECDTVSVWYKNNAGVQSTGPVIESTPTYRQSVRFRNMNYKYDLTIKGTVFGNAEFSVPLSQAILDTPAFKAGDYFWDMTITGQTGVDVTFLNKGTALGNTLGGLWGMLTGNIWGVLGTIVVVGVVIFVIWTIFQVIKKRALGRITQIHSENRQYA